MKITKLIVYQPHDKRIVFETPTVAISVEDSYSVAIIDLKGVRRVFQGFPLEVLYDTTVEEPPLVVNVQEE